MRSQLSKDEFTQFWLKPRENNFFVSCLNWRFLSWLVQSFKESFRGGNLFKNLAIFWMNKKTIVVFGFCMMWRIVQILGGCYPPRPSASVDNILLICRILNVIQKPNSIIVKCIQEEGGNGTLKPSKLNEDKFKRKHSNGDLWKRHSTSVRRRERLGIETLGWCWRPRRVPNQSCYENPQISHEGDAMEVFVIAPYASM